MLQLQLQQLLNPIVVAAPFRVETRCLNCVLQPNQWPRGVQSARGVGRGVIVGARPPLSGHVYNVRVWMMVSNHMLVPNGGVNNKNNLICGGGGPVRRSPSG